MTDIDIRIAKITKIHNKNSISLGLTGIELQRRFNAGVVKIIQDADCVIFGGYLRDLLISDAFNVDALPMDIDALVRKQALPYLIRQLSKHCDVVPRAISDEEYSNIHKDITISRFLIQSKSGLFSDVVRCRIALDCVVYDCPLNIKKILRRPDFNINTLYMRNYAIGAAWSQLPDIEYTIFVLKRIKKSIKHMKAYYMGLPREIIDSDFEVHKSFRRSIFLRSIKMLSKGFEIVGVNYFLIIKPKEECVICAERQAMFIGISCCKGITCLECFKHHVMEELDVRISYRCMFHHDPNGSGFSVIPKVNSNEF